MSCDAQRVPFGRGKELVSHVAVFLFIYFDFFKEIHQLMRSSPVARRRVSNRGAFDGAGWRLI